MPIGPRPADVSRIRRTVGVYKVSSYITGSFLLLLCLMMVLRYGFGVDIEFLGAYGLLALTPKELIDGINLSSIILIVHGWLYVLYLACDFVLWRLVRFSFLRFCFIALGGVVPLLSFYFERTVPRLVEARIAGLQPAEPVEPATPVKATA
jgi:integral membrane protein